MQYLFDAGITEYLGFEDEGKSKNLSPILIQWEFPLNFAIVRPC